MYILLAEDNFAHKNLLEKLLKGMGHETASAPDGVGLIKLAMQRKPDLILADLHMPNMKGDTMISMMSSCPGICDVPVIVVTGITPQEVEEMALNPNIPVFYKPLDIPKFSAALEKIKKRS